MVRMSETLVAEAIGLPPELAIAHFQALGYEITWDWREQAATAERKAFTVAKVVRMDVLQDIKGMVQKALDDGITFQDFQKELAPKLFAKGWWGVRDVQGPNGITTTQLGSPHRLKTIYHTNLQAAYMEGRYQEQQEDRESRPYLRYVATADSSTRPEHMAMHGKIFHIDDPIWDIWYPLNGYGCRCDVVGLTLEEVEQKGGVTPSAPKILPDVGFRTSPAVAWKPDMRKYSPEIREAAKTIQPPQEDL